MKPTLAGVLRQHGQAYLDAHPLSTPQAKAWRAICACRTAALGGQCLGCSACGHQHWQYHSCRNRHCPNCGARASDAWLQQRMAQVLDVPYTHMVFALPHEFNALYRQQPKALMDALFASVQRTISEFAANARWMGVTGGRAAFTLVLHTWSQDLGLHLHLHAIVAAGVLQDGLWHRPVKGHEYLFPTRALSRVWRGKFMGALKSMGASTPNATSNPPPSLNPAQRQALWRKDWVVYAKTPLGGAAQVLQYLSRYTHRSAIGNERIWRITGEEVIFNARANDTGGKRRVRLSGQAFIHRFMQHILPTGLQRIRHYGVLANPCAKQRAQARAALHMPRPQAQALEDARAFMSRVNHIETQQCSHCKTGHLQVIQTLPGQKHLPSPMQCCAPSKPARPTGVPP